MLLNLMTTSGKQHLQWLELMSACFQFLWSVFHALLEEFPKVPAPWMSTGQNPLSIASMDRQFECASANLLQRQWLLDPPASHAVALFYVHVSAALQLQSTLPCSPAFGSPQQQSSSSTVLGFALLNLICVCLSEGSSDAMWLRRLS